LSSYICHFTEAESLDKAVVGGKAANLGRLTQAGFSVPPGFTVTTKSYIDFLEASGLAGSVRGLVDGIDFADADDVEAKAAAFRAELLSADFPAGLGDQLRRAYQALGSRTYVAVRSSGTAEDLAEASYAGMHDTYLDICGPDAVLDAIKQCWASLWTARATAYRHNQGIDQTAVHIAVVVQSMVSSEVAGVMFTGNPLTTATDELVINASWGLGEAVVGGTVNPDQFVVKAANLKTKDKVLGSKTHRIARDPDRPSGVVTQDVPEPDRARFSLGDDDIARLCELGLKVQAHYGGLPQDIEWGYQGGTFYLLQARPITGVEFSWDDDVDAWQMNPEDDEAIWTRGMADEVWTGAITPLMYSWRAWSWDAGSIPATRLWGLEDLAQTRFWKFHKGEAYYNCNYEKLLLERTAPPALRPFMPSALAKLPPQMREELEAAPFSHFGYAKVYARVQLLAPQLVKGFAVHENYITNRNMEAAGLDDTEVAELSDMTKPFAQRNLLAVTNRKLHRFSDVELVRWIERGILWEDTYNVDQWTWFFMNARDMFALLGYLTVNWYSGDAMSAYMDLITGAPKRTITPEANLEMWRLTEQIRKSPQLLDTFRTRTDGEFFTAAEDLADGREFLNNYRAFLDKHGHRGHADRDIYFSRRIEDPSIDYAAFRALLSVETSTDPTDKEAEIDARREETTERVLADIRKKSFGGLRAELFKVVLAWVHRFLMARDNERHCIDYATFSIRLGFLELNRRLMQRGTFQTDRDFYFLSKDELFDVFLRGAPVTELTRAKIAGRMRDFDRFDSKERMPGPYLHRGREMDFDTVEDGEHLIGLGTARGTVTGTARVVKSLKDIGSIRSGEILVTNSTDPGWTPVFNVVSGIVLETGGVVAHGACLAREYGFPAVQLANAMQRIPDGATITIHGDIGEVILLDAAPTELSGSHGDGQPNEVGRSIVGADLVTQR
jgi:phosphohistidine swiveling domain-containing protein